LKENKFVYELDDLTKALSGREGTPLRPQQWKFHKILMAKRHPNVLP
jgi:hypothetical protein